MFDENYVGENEMEVAEPSTETEDLGENEVEVAEQPSDEVVKERDYDHDSAYAEMRRNMQEAERRAKESEERLAILEAENKVRDDTYRKLTGGNEDAIYEALAEQYGLEVGDVRAEFESARTNAMKDFRIEQLENELATAKAREQMSIELANLQKIDPSIKDLSELGDDFPAYIRAGLSAEQAYRVIKHSQSLEKSTPPKPIGRVQSNEVPEKEYFTEEEVDKMSPAEQKKNADKIIRSMSKW